jgi:hypothetical protein
MLDIRLPLGLLLSALGTLLTGYGAITSGDSMYIRYSLGININLWWGIVLLCTGLILLGLLARARAADKRSSTEPSAQ